jgi:hypothetical protein
MLLLRRRPTTGLSAPSRTPLKHNNNMPTEPANINKRPLDHTGTSPPLNVSPEVSEDPAASVQHSPADQTDQQRPTDETESQRPCQVETQGAFTSSAPVQKLSNHSVPSAPARTAELLAAAPVGAASPEELPAGEAADVALKRLKALLLASRPPADTTALLLLLPPAPDTSWHPLLLARLLQRDLCGLPAGTQAWWCCSALWRAAWLPAHAPPWMGQVCWPDAVLQCSSRGASSGTAGCRVKGSRNSDMRRERRRCRP